MEEYEIPEGLRLSVDERKSMREINLIKRGSLISSISSRENSVTTATTVSRESSSLPNLQHLIPIIKSLPEEPPRELEKETCFFCFLKKKNEIKISTVI